MTEKLREPKIWTKTRNNSKINCSNLKYQNKKTKYNISQEKEKNQKVKYKIQSQALI